MRILILGGTGDATTLAAKASQIPDLEVVSSIAGRTQTPIAPVGAIRVGGFGGAAGLAQYLRENQIDRVIDATHPFAAQISWNAAQAAAEVGIPHVMLIRPAWEKTEHDRWIEVADIESAVCRVEAQGQRVFLTIGRQQLAPFARLQNIWFLMRSIDSPTSSIPNGKILLDRGPFTVQDERRLIADYNIDMIVSKNSGGNATYAKIIAAREMEIPIVMIDRPAVPIAPQVSSVDAALRWLTEREFGVKAV